MEKRPQTFIEACQEFHDAVVELGHALISPFVPFVEWLNKKREEMMTL